MTVLIATIMVGLFVPGLLHAHEPATAEHRQKVVDSTTTLHVTTPVEPADTAHGTVPDSLTDLWSNDAFSALEDGQPAGPGDAEINGELWWERHHAGPDAFWLEISPEYTPAWSNFWSNTQLSAQATLRRDRSSTQLDAVGVGWQHRWLASTRRGVTAATHLEADILTASGESGTELTLTGVITATIGPGIGYLNGAVTKGYHDGSDARLWLAAYKLPLDQSAYLHFGAVSEAERGERSANTLEAAAVLSAGEDLSISPGLVIGLGHREVTPEWELGVAMKYTF